MRISILGAGNIGGTLGRKWAQAGHQVMFGVRDVRGPKLQRLLETIQGNVSSGDIATAIASGDVVLFATPWSAVEPILEAHAGALDGKIVLDATNNFGGPVVSNVETISARVPSARVFRAFNSLGWENFEQPQFGATQADLFYCGPGGATRSLVEALIADVGLRPVRVGDLDMVRLVDNIGSLWVTLAFRQDLGRRLAFKVLTE